MRRLKSFEDPQEGEEILRLNYPHFTDKLYNISTSVTVGLGLLLIVFPQVIIDVGVNSFVILILSSLLLISSFIFLGILTLKLYTYFKDQGGFRINNVSYYNDYLLIEIIIRGRNQSHQELLLKKTFNDFERFQYVNDFVDIHFLDVSIPKIGDIVYQFDSVVSKIKPSKKYSKFGDKLVGFLNSKLRTPNDIR